MAFDLRHRQTVDRRHARTLDTAGPRRRCRATVALVAANLFVVAFGMSWGPVVWVLLGEMFPNRMRAAALSAGRRRPSGSPTGSITVSFPTLKDIWLGFAYGLYAAFALLSLFFVIKFIARPRASNSRTCTTI